MITNSILEFDSVLKKRKKKIRKGPELPGEGLEPLDSREGVHVPQQVVHQLPVAETEVKTYKLCSQSQEYGQKASD